MIAIVDYGMGNLRSVQNGFEKVGVEAEVVTSAQAINDAKAVVLPGVGAFADCMLNLDRLGVIGAIRGAIDGGKPFLGICLGLQVLFGSSVEFGSTSGLGVFEGKVIRFPKSGLKVPHMGWNSLKIKNRPPILKDSHEGGYFYFVHSYYVAPEDESIVAATTGYGVEFTSMVWRDNVMATQFHPEKSQRLGLEVLKAFGELVGKA